MDYNFDDVKEFKYLGTLLTENTDEISEMNCKTQAGNMSIRHKRALKSKLTSRSTKGLEYSNKPAVTYGWEAGNLGVANDERLRVFERRILYLERGEYFT